ncbi:hypothetical protein EST38_g3006 [Candolleomyces aberdarensis]|uniref:Uncharacterized protein n=1 Tax=Candolleomyces aberdarensis TaxID=2316362 RepID=A0A4Q2DT39_9AGAR|nr:hypothetical protein EST38_g3006 [Candolleomyces aberdarensis]
MPTQLSNAPQTGSKEAHPRAPARPPPTYIPSILFSQSLRLFCVRCILVAGCFTLAYEIYWWGSIPGTIILSVTILHHLLSALGPQFVPLFGIMDILLIVSEILYCSYALRTYTASGQDYRWNPKRDVFGVASTLVLVIMLGALLSVKIVQLIDARGATILRRVDILRSRLNFHELKGAGEDLGRLKGWRYPARVLFGTKLWERKFPGEPLWIAVSRGLLSLIVMSAIVAFGIFAIVLEPVSEMGVVPTRELRSSTSAEAFWTSTPITRKVILTWPSHMNATKYLADAVSLTPLWTRLDVSGSTSGPTCSLEESFDVERNLPDNTLGMDLTEQMVVFTCPPHKDIPRDLSDPWLFFNYRQFTQPDLKLTVNFTELLNPNEQPGEHGTESDSLLVYVTLTNNTDDAVASTTPIHLLPGTNIVGITDTIVRQRLTAAHLSTLGFLDVYDTFLITKLAYTLPEPLAAVSSDYPTGPMISTIRIISTPLEAEWLILQDYRTKSILGGFAEVGGLGSFLSVIFVVLFGNTLLGIAHRIKPLTPFGVLHQLDTPRERLFRSSTEQYRDLRADIQSLKESPGLMKFVLDTLIDLDVIAEEPPMQRKYDDIERVEGPLTGPETESLIVKGEEADIIKRN